MRDSVTPAGRSRPPRTPRRGAPRADPYTKGLLGAVWERQRGRIGERLASIERAVRALARDELDAETRRVAERAAHMLAGSLGTFGFAGASDAARELERELAAGAVTPGRSAYWQDLLDVVTDAVADGAVHESNTALTR
ncbi:MAG TPA: Hpt domain-containing protein [Solirubrobacteraceae bacterium]|nr:Hpt domain-containing protein [Solirubrobacteraceae bacterium]